MFLIIDTASAKGLIALCEGDKVVLHQELSLGLANSRLLEPSLEKLLKDASIRPKDLEFVAVGHGPGSYTGLRVAAASAKAISIACHIPLVGISSLRGYIPPSGFRGHYLAAIDAKIGGVYVQEALAEEAGIRFIDEEQLVPFDAFLQKLKTIPFIATPMWAPLAKRLEGLMQPTVFECSPSPHELLLEAKKNFINKKYSLDGSLEIRYLRLTQAEMEKQ